MQRFLPYLKSKELEKEFRHDQHNKNSQYFAVLCLVELINYSYGFGSVIQEGVINSKLIASYVTIIMGYTICLLFIRKKLLIAMYLIPLGASFFPLIRWTNDTKSLSLAKSTEYMQGMVNVLQFIFHIQSPSFFFKLFCIACYAVQESIFSLDAESEQAQYAVIGLIFSFFMLKQLVDDQRQRSNFLQNQRLFMWSQLIDQQIKMSFLVAKPKKKNQKNTNFQSLYSNKIQMQFINKYARSKYAISTSEQFNSFLERIIIQDEDEELIEEAFRSRFVSEKMSSNRLLSTSKGRSPKRNLFQICQELIEASQKQNYKQTLSNISACQEFTGTLMPQKLAHLNLQGQEGFLTLEKGLTKGEEQESQQQQQEQQDKNKSKKAQVVRIKLYYYNLTEDYLIIQIEEEDYKLKLKKQRDEQKKALAFRDQLTIRMESQVKNIISNLKINFDQFKLLPNYKSIMLDIYWLKQYQQNILTTFTDYSIHAPYEVCQVNLKLLMQSLLNLFSDDQSANKASIPNEIFTFDLKEEVISTLPTCLNHILFNLMLNGKQHGAKNSEMQIKVSQDTFDSNVVNVDVVSELQQQQEEMQLVCIEEMNRIQTQEDLFAFYYQRQNLFQQALHLKDLTNQIKHKIAETAEYNKRNITDNKLKSSTKEMLKYTLGIYVSRQSLKKIGPFGVINYSRTKSKDKSFLVASFQIYKDIEDTYLKEKESFIDVFGGKNSVYQNVGLATYNSFLQKKNTLVDTLNNQNFQSEEQKDEQYWNESLKQKKSIDNQQNIKDFLYTKALEMLKNQDTDINQYSQSDETTLQNYKNHILNNQIQFQPDQLMNSQKQNQSVDKMMQQAQQINGRSSLLQNITIPQKSFFYRDSTQEDFKNQEEENNKYINDCQKQDFAIQNNQESNITMNSSNGNTIQIENETDDKQQEMRNQVQEYQQSFKKNPGLLTFSRSSDLMEQQSSSRQGQSFLQSQRDNLFTKEQDFMTTQRNNKIELSQNDDQIQMSTPDLFSKKILKKDYPLLENINMFEDLSSRPY